MRVPVSQRPQDLFEYSIKIAQNFLIPKSHHPIVVRLQISRSACVVFLSFCMLPSVGLDNQPRIQTNEVRDVSAHR